MSPAAMFDRMFSKFREKKQPATVRMVEFGSPSQYQKLPLYDPELKQKKFASNKIITSKYTPLTFLPKNLFEQFRRLANFYFLIVAIVHLSIDSPIPAWTSILPLLFVVTVTAVKQGYEDYRRHREDATLNSSTAIVVRAGREVNITSEEVGVGDIVRVGVDEQVPCDALLLLTSDGGPKCSATTANLDGETNAKEYKSPECLRMLSSVEDLSRLSGVVRAQLPHPNLYDFKGSIESTGVAGEESLGSSLSTQHLLLRGSRMVGQEYIYGLALYTGKETKMILNSKMKTGKFSTIEKSMNRYLLLYLVLMLSWIVTCTVLKYQLYSYDVMKNMWYLGLGSAAEEQTDLGTVLQDGFSFFILYSWLIPISLYVTLEMQKFGGAMFFEWDDAMKEGPDGEHARCNTSDLNEELGQIQHLFCDKTGTLTENHMSFRRCSVGAQMYRHRKGVLWRQQHKTFTPVKVLSGEVVRFLTALCLCNTVQAVLLRARTDNQAFDHEEHVPAQSVPGQQMEITRLERKYISTSPDEIALVQACAKYGVVLLGTEDDNITVDVLGKKKVYKLKHIFHFRSERQRMSVCIQSGDGTLWVISKGADSALLPRCLDGHTTQKVKENLHTFALDGLRTLVVAGKKITTEDLQKITDDLETANKEVEGREEAVSRVYDTWEQGLLLLGATGVQDDLQAEVALTLRDLRSAGINVWVLTGDKLETAVNVSLQCGHFQPHMLELAVTGATDDVTAHILLDHAFAESTSKSSSQLSLLVDGATLKYLLDKKHRKMFRELALRCSAVLCCRLSPKQKAEVVRLVKTAEGSPITAAIGDGANDVSMIQEAHVGLGIMGSEGRQAVRCADFGFSRFKFLRRALLVHGHWYYIRVTVLVHYSFYKNVAFITPQLYFGFYSALSTQSLYAGWYLSLYNLTMCGLPVLVYGLLEQNYPDTELLKRPQLYRTISKDAHMKWSIFLLWLVFALFHSTVMYFGLYFLTYGDVAVMPQGTTLGMDPFGTMVVTLCVVVINLKLLLEANHLDVVLLGSFLVTLLGYVATLALYTIPFPISTVCGDLELIVRSPCLLFAILLLTVACLLPDIVLLSYRAKKRRRKQQRDARVGEEDIGDHGN